MNIASASVKLFDNKLVIEEGDIDIPSRNRYIVGSRKWRIGILMAIPTMFTIKNMSNCVSTLLLLESGYVQNRFQIKLLMTAKTKEMVPAVTKLKLISRVSRFIIEKSTIAPNAPTTPKRKKRTHS